jgi:ABC-type nitrate/sulfonate/bicarbonate transport system substrate-binding protein
MRGFLCAGLLIALLLAGCGATGVGGGSGRDLNLALDGAPAGKHAGVYLAVARGYDRALGVTLRIGREPADVRLTERGKLHPERDVAVMALLPGELYLTTDRITLDERRDDVRGAVEALQRGYEESIVDPESAVATMTAEDPALDRVRLEKELDDAAPGFKRGASEFGAIDAKGLAPGTFDRSLVGPSDR